MRGVGPLVEVPSWKVGRGLCEDPKCQFQGSCAARGMTRQFQTGTRPARLERGYIGVRVHQATGPLLTSGMIGA